MRPTTIIAALAIAGFTMTGAVAQQAPMGAQGQPMGQSQAFCLKRANAADNCGFATMAQCEASNKGGVSGTCSKNPQTMGSSTKPSGTVSQPTTGMAPSNPSGSRGSSNPTNPSK